MLHFSQHLADGDAEYALATAHKIDDLVVRGAQVDARAITHECRLGEVVDSRFTQLVNSNPNLLQRDPGIEKPLDELEHEDVAEPVQPLRTGTRCTANGRFDKLGTSPVIQLAIADPRRAGGNCTAVAGV